LNDMPCGKEKVIDYEDPILAAIELKNAIINGKLFGFVKCKLATPKTPWTKFEEMPPIFVKLLGALEVDEILLYTPLLRWYIEHGLELQAVYTTIEYQPGKILVWFFNEVTDARRMGDTDKEKAIFAEVFKLLKKQQLWKNDRGLRKAHQRELYEG